MSKSCLLFCMLMFIFSSLILTFPVDSDAARMGGGRSFGSSSSMSTPAQKPAMRQQTAGQQSAQTSQSGRFGGMGGIIGGLLAGTLLGSLLAGNGFSGGGFFDLIILAIIAFVAYKLFIKFRQAKSPAPAPVGDSIGFSPMQRNMSGNPSSFGQYEERGTQRSETYQKMDIPANFNVNEFLRGAKLAYTRLQKSWDERNMEDIAQFVTPPVMDVLKEDLAANPNPGKTDILQINADLVDVEQDGESQRAQVYFDVLMRENEQDPAPEQVREIWHFVKKGDTGNWKLDGIQQVQ